MLQISIAQAKALRTREHPIVVLGSSLIGVAGAESFAFHAWTDPRSSLFMSRWCAPEGRDSTVRRLRVPRTMALGALRKFLNHIQRQTTSAVHWGISFGGTISILLPSGRISNIVVRDNRVFEDRVAKWWATRYNYKRVA